MLKLESGNRVIIEVGDSKRSLDIETDTSISDLDEDMRAMPGLLAWYHRCLAAAHAQLDHVESEYRQWQARLLRDLFEDDPKIAEWKAKAAVTADGDFSEWKEKQAAASELVARLAGAVSALEVKASMLQSLGAMARSEATHLEPSTRRTAPKKVDVDERGRQLRERLRSQPEDE